MAVTPQVGRPLARLVAASLVALVTLLPAATPALAADPILSRPTATVRFLSQIAFSGTAELSAPVRRLEIVLEVEGSTRSIVGDLGASRASGRRTLQYVLETPSGGLAPNTDVTARFRATLDDGTLIDGPRTTVSYEDTRYDWQALSGDLVTVHWTEGGAAFGRRALRIAEDAVARVSDLLGVTETDPIDFFVYSDEAAFYDVLGPGLRENVGGFAWEGIRTLFANISPDQIDSPWVGSVVPHELTHLVFDTAVRNPYHDPPRWLNEGIATYLADGYELADRRAVRRAVESGTLLPLRALAGLPPTQAEQFHLAYAEYPSAVDFLVRRYGEGAMVSLVRSYANGVTDDEAFQAALGTDVAGFEAAWLDDLGTEVPLPYGPVEAPPGPLPSDWAGEGPVPGYLPNPTGTAAPVRTAGPATPGTAGGDGVWSDALVALAATAFAIAAIGLLAARGRRGGGWAPAGDEPPDPGTIGDAPGDVSGPAGGPVNDAAYGDVPGQEAERQPERTRVPDPDPGPAADVLEPPEGRTEPGSGEHRP
jgi:hypothetical protein